MVNRIDRDVRLAERYACHICRDGVECPEHGAIPTFSKRELGTAWFALTILLGLLIAASLIFTGEVGAGVIVACLVIGTFGILMLVI